MTTAVSDCPTRAALAIDSERVEYVEFNLNEDLEYWERVLCLSITVNQHSASQDVLDILRNPKGHHFSFYWGDLLIEAKGCWWSSTVVTSSRLATYTLVLEKTREEFRAEVNFSGWQCAEGSAK